jgi:hypothetical protein
MSSWGVLLALSGFSYSGPEMRMGFDPKMNADDFRTVWTSGSGWGVFSQKADPGKAVVLRLEAGSGTLDLKELAVVLPPAAAGKQVRSVKGTLTGAATKSAFRQSGNVVRIQWSKPIRVEPGKPLSLKIAF